jgi:hypothetical protein
VHFFYISWPLLREFQLSRQFTRALKEAAKAAAQSCFKMDHILGLRARLGTLAARVLASASPLAA